MPFDFATTEIPGIYLITPGLFLDDRGFFMESWKKSEFQKSGINEDFVQDNHSFSSRGVLRGLHFQREPESQGKLVRVITGAVWDVAVDIRPDSGSFGKWYGTELNEENPQMVYIPPGFAHGFLVLSDSALFHYHCTTEYAPEFDAAIAWNDPDINVNWPIEPESVSTKDSAAPRLCDVPSERLPGLAQ